MPDFGILVKNLRGRSPLIPEKGKMHGTSAV